MRTDKELQKKLVEITANYKDSVPVFKIRIQNAEEIHNEAVRLALPFTNAPQSKELRFDVSQKENHVLLQLQDNATLQYFPASGYKQFQRNTPAYMHPVSENATDTNKQEYENAACNILEKNRLNLSGSLDNLKFENLFQLKSAGMSSEKKLTPVVLNRLVYAYRRFVNELPVLGCASVYIKTAAESQVDAFGIDWRYIHDDPITMTTIINPEEAAKMVLEQLQNTNPQRVYTEKEINIVSFELGYFSHSKVMYQTMMQPVYVARFIFNGKFRMGYVVAVPGSGTSFESICRKVTPPPSNAGRNNKNNNLYKPNINRTKGC